MDKMLIFICRLQFRWGDKDEYAERIIEFNVLVSKMGSWQIRSPAFNGELQALKKIFPRESQFRRAIFLEKPLRLNCKCPY